MSIDSVVIVVIGSLLSAFSLTLAWKLWMSAVLLSLELDDADERDEPVPPPPANVVLPVAAAAPPVHEDFDKARTQFFVVAKDNSERTEIFDEGVELPSAPRSSQAKPGAPPPPPPSVPPPPPSAQPSPPRVPPPPPLRRR